MFRSLLLLLNGFLFCLAMLMGIYSLSEVIYDNPAPERPAYNISGRILSPRETVRELTKEPVSAPQAPLLVVEGLSETKMALERLPKSENRFSDKRRDEIQKLEQGSDSLIATDALEGARLFRQCAACHSVRAQGPNRVGPSLWNVVERPVASLDNYRYSGALQRLGQVGALWDEVRLDAYLTSPAKAVVGTTMAFRGLVDAQARAAIIAYLRTLVPQEGEKEIDVP